MISGEEDSLVQNANCYTFGTMPKIRRYDHQMTFLGYMHIRFEGYPGLSHFLVKLAILSEVYETNEKYFTIMPTIEIVDTSITFVELAALVEADSVTLLRLTNVKIEGDDDDAFLLSRSLRGHPSLEEVSFVNVTLAQEGMKIDAMIEMMLVSCQSLTVLNLDNVPVQAKSVATVAYCETLKTLSLPNNGFNNIDAKTIADAVEASKSVESLDLSGNKISDTGCKSLALCLEKNKIIQKMTLSGNSISGTESTKLESALQARTAVAA